jgi:hypothetical protein
MQNSLGNNVGMVYKRWGAERKLHLGCRTWDSSEKSQTKHA